MGFKEDDVLAQDAEFQSRVKQASIRAATEISSEAETTKNVVDSKRNTLAKNVLNDANAYMVRFTHAVIQSGTAFTTASPDADIFNAVSAVWNGIAGVTTADKT